jgi:hypothetical protein
MKVLDLQCSQHHVFEGWFGSEDEFASQIERGLVACPMCADTAVSKKLSAPRLNLGGAREPEPLAQETPAVQDVVSGTTEQALQAAWLTVARRILAQTEDVGSRFAEEARKIHYGEKEERAIRGQATREQTEALLDEGISVLPLPIPDALKGPVQ